MAPFRNFLGRRAGPPNSGELETPPTDNSRLSSESHRSNPLSFRKSHEIEPPEYKLSVVDANGDYLPPSPPEKESFWRKYPGANRSPSHRNLVDENEPFSISRESFDSYRRSFDISARSPVSYTDATPSRTSLDSRVSRLTSPSEQRASNNRAENVEEDHFEDIGLDDDVKPKKRGIFSRLGDFTGEGQGSSASKSSSHLGFHIPGRKRGQSGAGSELGAMKSPPPPGVSEVREG